MTTNKALQLIAEYDGWVYCGSTPNKDRFLYEKEHLMDFLDNLCYLTNLNELHRVALGVINKLVVEFNEATQVNIYAEASTLIYEIKQKLIYAPVDNQYIDLLFAVAKSVEFINKNK